MTDSHGSDDDSSADLTGHHPNDSEAVGALIEHALRMRRLAREQVVQGALTAAAQSFEQSLDQANRAIESHPTPGLYALKGDDLHNLAQLRKAESLNKLRKAFSKTRENGTSYKASSSFDADWVERDVAITEYREASTSFQKAATLEPDNPNHHAARARTLTNLATLLSSLGPSPEDALRQAEEAIRSFNAAIDLSPDDRALLLEKSSLLISLSTLHSWVRSEAYLAQVIEEMLRLEATDSSGEARLRKIAAMIDLARLKERLGHYEDAVRAYQGAIDEAEREDSTAAPTHHVTGEIYTQLARMYAEFGLRRLAKTNLKSALSAYQDALFQHPDDFVTSSKRAHCLQMLGDVESGFASGEYALNSYEQAVLAYDELLGIFPEHPNLRFRKGQTLAKIAELQCAIGNRTRAIPTFKAAREEIGKAQGAPIGEAVRFLFLDEIEQLLAECEAYADGR
jgi:tetratricopeptide (TPR) repeat protein